MNCSILKIQLLFFLQNEYLDKIPKGNTMIVDDSLVIVGNDTIKDLYNFVAKRQSLAQQTDDFTNWLMYTRILVELSLAITSYTANKEK